TVVAAPRLSAATKGKQPARARSPAEPSDVEWTEAEQLKIVLKKSRHEMHISQQGGSGIDEGTGSKPRVPDIPSDDSEEELLWNSSDDEDVDTQTKGRDESEGEKTDESDDDDDDDQEEADKVNDDDDNEEEVPKTDEQDTTESDEGDDEATESDRESMESIFTTGSTTITPIPSPQSTMTPSVISTFTTASQLPTPPTQIPSLDLQSLPTFASVFRLEDRVKLLEVNFSNLSDKTILDTYGESAILKRRREDDDQEGPSAGSDWGSKRQREGAEHASASTPSEPATGSTGRSTTGTQSQQLSASESTFAEEPVQTTSSIH
nr:hypothetical protein [Tanacetum cinerariifolium]